MKNGSLTDQGGSGGKASDLYYSGSQFESRPGHSWLRFCCVFLFAEDEYRESTLK
jgi:hypothetical protein